MSRNLQRASFLALALAAGGVLCLAFLLLPQGWNVIPLLLLALVLPAVCRHLAALRGDSRTAPLPDSAPGSAPAGAEDATPPAPRSLARRLNRAFGPIAAGLIIDLVDLATFGPVGLVFGFPLGALAGYWMGRALDLSRKAAAWCAVAAGVYAMIPGTEFIPLATLVGAFVRFSQTDRDQDPKSTD